MRNLLSPATLLWVFLHATMVLCGIIVLLLAAGMDSRKDVFLYTVVQGLGGSLVATGIAGEALYLYLRANDEISDRLQMYLRAGLQAIWPVRSVQIQQEYRKRLQGAKRIDIIGFGLASLRQDFGKDFGDWSKNSVVRILLIDPEFPDQAFSYADQRDREERNQHGKTRLEVAAFVDAVRRDPSVDQARFEVRLMQCLPSINVFRIDRVMFWGPYILDQSRNTPTMLVEQGGFMFEKFEEHFEVIWETASRAA